MVRDDCRRLALSGRDPVRRIRTIGTIGGVLIALALVASPAGAYDITVDTGTTAQTNVNDTTGLPGVTCRFERNPGVQNDELNKIKIRRVSAHGPFPQKSWVGFRFIVKRNSPPLADDKFRTVFRSAIRKERANDADVAFFSGEFVSPENVRSRYRVLIEFIFYAQGSQTQVIGKEKGLLEVYKHTMRGGIAYENGSEGDPGWCQRNFHGL
jgi:hypothetical protein